MAIPFKSFETLTNDAVTAVQASSDTPIDFNAGTVELALIESNSAMGVVLEYQCNDLLSQARAQTCQGVTLDTWMAQYYNTYTNTPFQRLPAVAASGNCTFSRFTTTSQALVPVGTVVKTSNFNIQFSVIPDNTNPNYNPSLNAYVLAPSVSSTSAKVECVTPGISGNVGANQITLIVSVVPGIDTVTNLLPFTNGKSAQSDASFLQSFVLYMQSLSRATLLSYAYVLNQIPEITRYNVVENQTFIGGTQLGFVYTVIDDGTGTPPPDLITKAEAAIETVRGLAIQNAVYSPNVITAIISVDLLINPSASQSDVTTAVTNALTIYINTLPILNSSSNLPNVLSYSKLYEVIYDASAQIVNAENLLLNGSTIDLPGAVNSVFIAGSITIGYI